MPILANTNDMNRYLVAKLASPIIPTAEWDHEPWNSIQPIELTFYMGDKPDHFPKVLAKLAYDDEAIYVIYKVEDQYVLAATKNYQGPVYTDSCVEFFFTPHEDVSLGYFNLEMNCGGTALFNFQPEPRTNVLQIPKIDFDQIQIAHSMPEIISPEITEPVTWFLEYRIPFSILEKYSKLNKPAPGVKWRANLYKCADTTSHPHWLTWAKVEYNRPNFHLPEFFGELEFGDVSKVGLNDNKPETFELKSYPNPFNQQTTIQFSLSESSTVELSVFSSTGQKVATLINQNCQAGSYSINWDATGIASGIYFIRLKTGSSVIEKKVTIMS